MKIYTQSDFSRRIGKSKQWISNKIMRHKKRWGDDWMSRSMEFTSVDGETIKVKLVKAEGSVKWLMNIVSTQG
jgi:hypothetical protein